MSHDSEHQHAAATIASRLAKARDLLAREAESSAAAGASPTPHRGFASMPPPAEAEDRDFASGAAPPPPAAADRGFISGPAL